MKKYFINYEGENVRLVVNISKLLPMAGYGLMLIAGRSQSGDLVTGFQFAEEQERF